MTTETPGRPVGALETAREEPPAGPGRAELMAWDWSEQIDLDELGRIIIDMSHGQLHLHEVETGDDQYAIVLSDAPLTDLQAFEIYRNAP
jgi:hypothetical protein